MAEKVVSPGVFTNEIDASFLPAAIGDIGAVVIGQTRKGPAMIPTVVNSMAEFEATFGTTFRSGSNYFQYCITPATAPTRLDRCSRIESLPLVGSCIHTRSISIRHRLV